MADDWVAQAACAIIVVNGLLILKGASLDVLDGNVPSSIYDSIKFQAISVSGVENTEKFRIWKGGLDLFVEIHVRVAPLMTVDTVHKIGRSVKNHLISSNPRIRDVIIHIEPVCEVTWISLVVGDLHTERQVHNDGGKISHFAVFVFHAGFVFLKIVLYCRFSGR